MQDIQKRHIVANLDSVDLGNSVLCVLEYDKEGHFPTDLIVVAEYDEIDDKLTCDFSRFPDLEGKAVGDDSFDQYLSLVDAMEKIYLNSTNDNENKVSTIKIPVYTSIDHIKKKSGEVLCSEDFENKHMIEFAKDKCHIEYAIEDHYRNQSNLSPFGGMFLDDYLKDRMKRLGY